MRCLCGSFQGKDKMMYQKVPFMLKGCKRVDFSIIKEIVSKKLKVACISKNTDAGNHYKR